MNYLLVDIKEKLPYNNRMSNIVHSKTIYRPNGHEYATVSICDGQLLLKLASNSNWTIRMDAQVLDQLVPALDELNRIHKWLPSKYPTSSANNTMQPEMGSVWKKIWSRIFFI